MARQSISKAMGNRVLDNLSREVGKAIGPPNPNDKVRDIIDEHYLSTYGRSPSEVIWQSSQWRSAAAQLWEIEQKLARLTSRFLEWEKGHGVENQISRLLTRNRSDVQARKRPPC